MDKSLNRITAAFNSPDTENSFRLYTQPMDKRQNIIALILLMVPTVVFIRSDYILFGLTVNFYSLLAVRITVFLLLCALLILVLKTRSPWKLDQSILTMVILLSSAVLYINLSRPPDYFQHSIIDILIVLVCYFLVQNRYHFQIITALIYSVFAFYVFLAHRDPAPGIGNTVFWFSYIFANTLGIWYARYIHLTRREAFIALSEQQDLNTKLSAALDEVRTLKGIIPICSHCKKLRDSDGYWQRVEEYLSRHSDAQFSHGLCDDCIQELYGEEFAAEEKGQEPG